MCCSTSTFRTEKNGFFISLETEKSKEQVFEKKWLFLLLECAIS